MWYDENMSEYKRRIDRMFDKGLKDGINGTRNSVLSYGIFQDAYSLGVKEGRRIKRTKTKK